MTDTGSRIARGYISLARLNSFADEEDREFGPDPLMSYVDISRDGMLAAAAHDAELADAELAVMLMRGAWRRGETFASVVRANIELGVAP